MRVTLISTVFQEARTIADFLESVVRQTRRPDEVIIADGGSTDGTVQIMETFRGRLSLQIVLVPGANRSVGRNAAIERASGEVIACADAGCRLDERWLEAIVAPIEAGADAVGGYYKPDARTTLEQAVAFAAIPTADEVHPATFLPSSRSIAFRKSAWDAAGRYPEHLGHNEDTAFAMALREAAGNLVFEPRAIVYWRPRGSLGRVFVQFFRYAYGDGQCKFWFGHYTKAFLLLAIVAALAAAAFFHWWGWVALAVLAVCYEARYAVRSSRRGARLLPALLGSLVTAAIDAAHVLGWCLGSAGALFRRGR
jgi:glycosyltransferase involved in cell wall biosynthesis